MGVQKVLGKLWVLAAKHLRRAQGRQGAGQGVGGHKAGGTEGVLACSTPQAQADWLMPDDLAASLQGRLTVAMMLAKLSDCHVEVRLVPQCVNIL